LEQCDYAFDADMIKESVDVGSHNEFRVSVAEGMAADASFASETLNVTWQGSHVFSQCDC
jgi:hypothetical protein